MNKENLVGAMLSIDLVGAQLRAAHSDAINANASFAEIVIFGLIEEAANLAQKINRANVALMG